MTTTTKSAAPSAVREQDLLQSGGVGRPTNSSRAGLIPIPLEHIPVGALKGIPVYIRVRPGGPAPAPSAAPVPAGFCLYCDQNLEFGEFHRVRLVEHGVKFVYVRMADQGRLRRVTEAGLEELSANPGVAVREKSEIIYETSVELMNELLAEPELLVKSPRVQQISRSITTLVINSPSAFSHLFAVSHHDFYTATHMVNVATWMVPLAYELGHHDPEELNTICTAGILHDIGKTAVPEEILNKGGRLSDDDWAQIRRHPVAGCEYLARFGHVSPTVLAVTRRHHERLDGTGYPDGLRGGQIDPISRICAVVDSFDAMTAFRPFKERTLSVADALKILQREAPARYDPVVVEAWTRMMARAEEFRSDFDLATPGRVAPKTRGRNRRHPRNAMQCSARAHVLTARAQGGSERPGIAVVAHNLSRSGLGFLSQVPMVPGDFFRIYLPAKGGGERALEGQIVRCRTHNDSWHEVGMRFADIESDGDAAPPPPAAALR